MEPDQLKVRAEVLRAFGEHIRNNFPRRGAQDPTRVIHAIEHAAALALKLADAMDVVDTELNVFGGVS